MSHKILFIACCVLMTGLPVGTVEVAGADVLKLDCLRKKIVPADRFRKAGHPQAVSLLARPSINPHYQGGFIGGGAPLFLGEPGRLEEGTWGVDYVGVVLKRRVWLNWWHGRKEQGGTGAYETDGPHLKLHE